MRAIQSTAAGDRPAFGWLLGPLLSLIAGSPVFADGVTVVLRGSRIEQVSAGTTVLQAPQLAPGTSAGQVEFANEAFGIGAADGRDLATYFVRANAAPTWRINLGTWTDQGPGYDFFLFEVGGNDTLTVKPLFHDGSLGQPTVIGGWTGTGYTIPTGINNGQQVFGLAFRATQLKRANGTPLPQGVTLAGLIVESSSVDGAAFLAHRPNGGAGQDGDGSIEITGTQRAGQLTELVMAGPWASETDLTPNPFLDHRLRVTFQGPGGRTLVVPGFFDADGQGGEWGTVWKARFRPPVPGKWVARISFESGPGIAIDPSQSGTSGVLDGKAVVVQVGNFDTGAPGFLRWGTLRYVGKHYPRFDAGPYFIETGANSPENLLAYRGFDGVSKTPGSVGVLHSYAPHVQDWRVGDPLFFSRDHGLDSKGIIGGINYLSDAGINSLFFMPMNLGGDGQDVHPFLGLDSTDFDRTHYDTSRLAQWHVVFEHAARRGILLHLTLAETEPDNEQWLDGGGFGVQRKLFLRELIARFADHPALIWDLSEENDFPLTFLRAAADWIRDHDAYGHPVTFHNHFQDFSDYDQVLGEERFEMTAMQYAPDQADKWVEKYRTLSAASGHPWIVAAVEHAPWDVGLTDANYDILRKRILYDVLFSGGHLQWYAGWHPLPLGGDLTLEDFRTREEMWRDTAHAVELMWDLPFSEMEPADSLVSGENPIHGGAECFAKAGQVYAIFLPQADWSQSLDLSGFGGDFIQRWFDPREGTWIGAGKAVQAGGGLALGAPPFSPEEDWVCIVSRQGDLSADVLSLSASAGGTQTLFLRAPQHAGRRYMLLGSMGGTMPGFDLNGTTVPLVFDRYTRWTLQAAGGPILPDAIGVVPPSGKTSLHIVLPPGAFSALAGVTLHHAVVIIDPVDAVTIPVLLQIKP
jgi:Domain of unknown function (DUF5060)